MADADLVLPLPDPGETGPYTLVGRARAKPGLGDALERRLVSLVAPTRREAGVLAYHVHRDRSDPDLFVFFEAWHDRASLHAHLAQPYVQAFLAQRHALLAGDLEISWLRMCSTWDR